MMAAAREQPGGLDVLVNDAGRVEGPHHPQAPPGRWMATLALNLHAVMLATQLAVELMRGRGRGGGDNRLVCGPGQLAA